MKRDKISINLKLRGITFSTFIGKNNNNSEKNFYDWFRGICDAEGNFTIRIRRKNQKIYGFEFIFRISLHKDDLKTLELIQNKLNCGNIRLDRNTYVFKVSSLKDIETIIIPLFQKYPLMTKKHLDYLDFKKAFLVYKERQESRESNNEHRAKIIKLKNGMNDKRINFTLPENHILITANYLLGYIEGDGSFYFNKRYNTVCISLITLTTDRVLLEKIKEFLLNQLDENSLILALNTKLINVNNKNVKNNRKPITVLEIGQIDYICNYLIPFFDSLEFKTKKYLDYLDFRRIAFLILNGKHLSKKGRNLIIRLADTMNNSRLSTNKNKSLPEQENFNFRSELELLEKSEPLIKINPEGRALVISENKWIRSTYIIEANVPNGNILYFPTDISCAKAFSVSNITISRRLNDKKALVSKEKNVLALSLKRIRVYLKTKN